MNRLLSFFVLCGVFVFTESLRAGLALGVGEVLTYKVSWTVFRSAGEIKIMGVAEDPKDGKPRFKIVTTTATRGFARVAYSFDAKAESIFDVQTGRLVTRTETATSSDKEKKHSVVFDYAKSEAIYANPGKADSPKTLKMPAGDPVDIIMSLVQTRYWDMKPDDKRDALVSYDDEFYEITVHAEKYEDIKTPLGSFKTLVLVPRMEKGPPKGMFKRKSAVRVWISQDERHLPVKFELELPIGAGTATLIKYEPPADPPKNENKEKDKTKDQEAPKKEEAKPAASDAKNPGP